MVAARATENADLTLSYGDERFPYVSVTVLNLVGELWPFNAD